MKNKFLLTLPFCVIALSSFAQNESIRDLKKNRALWNKFSSDAYSNMAYQMKNIAINLKTGNM